MGANGVPNSTIKNPEFKAFVQEMDPKYPIPGTASLGKATDMLYLEMKAKIESCLLNTKSISLCTDVWTKKGMTSSYLEVTAHFSSGDMQSATIAVKHMQGSITGFAIRSAVDEILSDWDIPINKVKAVVTDNGSNMVRAFKEHIMVTDEEEEQDDSEEDSGQEDQERYCGLEEMGDQQEGGEEGDQQIQQEKEIDRLVVILA